MMTQQEALVNYTLRLADNALILGHRLSEMSSKGPFLEEDIALSNMALDMIGLANTLLEHAATTEGKGRTADDLAFKRAEREFYNALLVEQPNGDFANVMTRQFLIDAFEYHFYDQLKRSSDATLAAIAEKSHKEITYHLRHSSKWVERLGDGTEESHQRMLNALGNLWRFTGELFEMTEVDTLLLSKGIAVDLNSIRSAWEQTVRATLEKATLPIPQNVFMQRGSREGKHSEHLGYLLAEMQHLHRAFPGVSW